MTRKSRGPEFFPQFFRSGESSQMMDRLLILALMLLAPLALVFIAFHLLWGGLVAGLLFPVLPRRGADALMKFWSRILLVALGIRVELQCAPGAAPGDGDGGALLVCNHTSWADIFVIAAVQPARFVAKAELTNWPLLGRFAAACGTIFVERGRRHAVAHVNQAVVERLRAGQSMGIFPEGTTTDGASLLRFHANLLQPALDAGAAVVPLAIQYRKDGELSTAAAFIGEMNLAQSLWRILVTPRLRVRLYWLPLLRPQPEDTRQALAARARAAIAGALELTEASGAQETISQETTQEAPPILESAPAGTR